MAAWLKGDSPMAQAIRDYPWEDSPLGPIDAWPDVLKTTVGLCLGSHFPKAIVWGTELITLYNDAFVPILGGKPVALGRAFSDVWQEAWSEIQPIAKEAFDGYATFIEDFPLVVERGGSPERAYFTFCYSPIRDHNGAVVGILDTVTETTATVVSNQRLAFLDRLGRAVIAETAPERVLAITTRLLGEHLGLSNCAYADMEADQDGFTIRGDWAAPGVAHIVGHYSLADFGPRAVHTLRAGEPLVLRDTQAELEHTAAATFASLGLAATLCMPLLKDGRLAALMAIHDQHPRHWSQADLALLREVTARSWAHIERVRADSEMRRAADALAVLNATLEERVEERSLRLAEAEAALRQSQKLEAIGQLTGGVAHDFNNLLTIIRSSVHFLRQPELAEARRERYLQMIADSVERGARLTGQLLAFARRQALKPETFDVGERLISIADMLDSVSGASIHVQLQLPEAPCHVHADLGQFETALINMAINARDAMAGSGTLTLGLRPDCKPPVVVSSSTRFAAITVSDTGCGIPAAVLSRVFEPFFTTKAQGQGTGLGLSQVFGFAKQSGGEVEVQTDEGRGTTFTLYLPQQETGSEVSVPSTDVPLQQPSLRILVVDDNPQVGAFAVQLLQDLGHQASWLACAEEALDLLARDGAKFDAVLSDVVMPGLDGMALAHRVRERHPHLAVVLCSGYSEALAGEGWQAFEFLAKPYSARQLSDVLQKALAQSRAMVS